MAARAHAVAAVAAVAAGAGILIGAAAPAAAEPAARERRTLVYGELLGKGGPWGVGAEYALAPWVAVGAVVSAAVVRDQQIYALAPYVHTTLARRGGHALFAEMGAAIVHSRIPSPVPMWEGARNTGAGSLATLGWELSRARLTVRAYLATALGRGGAAPFGGVAIGARL